MRAGDTVSPNVGTYCRTCTSGVARLFRGGAFLWTTVKNPASEDAGYRKDEAYSARMRRNFFFPTRST